MFILVKILLLCHISGGLAKLDKSLISIPNLRARISQEEDLKRDVSYCYRFTWLGSKYDNMTFYEVKNKTCFEYFGKNPTLCIDPMTVTFKGGKPNLTYILDKHARQATCKLSEDQVCAKYTIYYNGIPSHIVRYCTRIDVESEGPMRSGCYTQKNGSFHYEICACISGHGREGICNSALWFRPNYASLYLTLTLSGLYWLSR